jgi:cell filamentation protein, protein adenylyltransferase
VRLLPSPALLRRPALRRKAQSTSALEGTYAPFEDVLAADRDDPAEWSAELCEVLKLRATAEAAFAWPSDRPISDQLRAGVEGLLRWLAGPRSLPAVVQAGMVHYQFETLHPYSDGNGRIGRLLVIVQFLRAGIIREPLLVVSPWFEQRRDQYQYVLLELSCTGEWDAWLRFLPRKESRHLHPSQSARWRRSSNSLVAWLYGVSDQGAAKAIKALVGLEIIQPIKLRGPHGAQMYGARDVLTILNS